MFKFLKRWFSPGQNKQLAAQAQAQQADRINSAQTNDAAVSRQLGQVRRRARGNAVLRYARG